MIEQRIETHGIRFSIDQGGEEVAHAYLYLMQNDLHDAPFGLLEDVFVSEQARGQGLGTKIVEQVIARAKELGCYKLIGTSRNSRPEVHAWYERLGFDKYGAAFRMDF